ncbi:MAG: hypothetical protein FJ087_18510 [Deltaproteobacteria bacterium]|nr:hypothetical protein [Deltaproteobacteria bacterium]
MIARLALLSAVALAGCASSPPAVSTLPVVSTPSEARAAVGRVVRVSGTAVRAKLGDAVDSPNLSVTCPDQRFPDDRLGGPIVVEGRLELTGEYAATVGPRGEVSQGTEAGVPVLVMRPCTVR